MPRPSAIHPTDGELEILLVLWDHGPLALSELCTRLRAQREVATTTIATMLRIMVEKQLVKRNGAGRGATWAAAVSRQSTAKRMVNQLVERVFDGSAERLAAHLVEGGRLTARELDELRELIDRHAPAPAPPSHSAPHRSSKEKRS